MYILILFLSNSALLISRRGYSRAVFYALLLIISLICGFRGETIGVDTPHYWNLFESINYGYITYLREPGYVFLVKFVSYLGFTQQLVFLLYALLTMFLFGQFIQKHSIDPMMSLFIFIMMGVFYLNAFNQMRQYLVIAGFVCFGISFILEKKFINYVLCLFILFAFGHLSAIFMLPFYFVLNRNFSFSFKIVLLVGMITASKLLVYLITLTPYAYFILVWQDEEKSNVLILTQLLFSCVLMLLEGKVIAQNKNLKIFFNMNYVSFLILLAIFFIPEMPRELLTRLNNYFFSSILILIPVVLHLFDTKSRMILGLGLVIFLSLYFLRNTYILGEEYSLCPYYFNFSLMK